MEAKTQEPLVMEPKRKRRQPQSGSTSQLLKDKGVPTFLTRMSDYYISLDERIALADAAEANTHIYSPQRPASAASKTPGTEVFAQSGDSESTRLSGLLHRDL